MKRFMSLLFTLICLTVAVFAYAADPAAVAPLDAGNIAASQQSIMAGFKLYTPIILGIALAISEALALIPQFQGNGLLDTIIKSLRALTRKEVAPPAGGA